MMKKARLYLWLLIALPLSSFAQTIQTNGTGGGDWNNPATWQGGVIPTSVNSTYVLVRAGDVVNIPTGLQVDIDQFTVGGNGATLNIATGAVFNILDGPGTDIYVVNNGVANRGLISVNGNIEFANGATGREWVNGSQTTNLTANTVTVRNGGKYRHKYLNGGAVIGALWEDGSTVEITSIAGGYSNVTNLTQSFYHFVWNCPAQTIYRQLGGLTTVRGNLTISSTGTSYLRFFHNNSNQILNVSGDVILSSGASVYFVTDGTNNTLNVGGNFTNTSTGTVWTVEDGGLTINVTGNFSHSSATALRFGNYNTSRTTLNLRGDLAINGPVTGNFGAITNFNFVSGGVQNFTRTGVITGLFNFTVSNGTTFNSGTSSLTGSGAFVLGSGSTFVAGAYSGNGTNSNGAIQYNTTQGNIRVPVSKRTFQNGSTVVYRAASAQELGNGHPNGANINVIFDNPVSVTQLNAFTAGSVTLNQGNMINQFNITVNGDWIVQSGQLIAGAGTVSFNGAASQVTGPGAKVFGNVTVNAPATVTLPDEDIYVAGNLSIVGVLNTNASTVVFNGGSNQTVSANGTEFNNIRVNKSGGGLSLTSALDLQGLLSIQTPTAVASDGFLRLLSTNDQPTADGTIGALPSGASVTGNVIVQRYMRAKGKTWRFVSAPVSGAPVSQLQDNFSITGKFTGTSYPCTGCNSNGTSFKLYQPSLVNKPLNSRFAQYPVNSNTEVLGVGRGYSAYMWESKDITWDLTGPINSGTINLPVTRATSTPSMEADGWNLVGNPYPSSIVWNNGAGWNRINISPIVNVPLPGLDQWATYNFVDGSGNLPGGIIAMGQAFWVYAFGHSPVLSINENAKTETKGGYYYREGTPVSRSAQLIVNLEGDGVRASAFLKTNQDATTEFDPLFDAPKLPGETLSISLLDKFGAGMLMHTLPEISEQEDIALDVEVFDAGSYSISFESDGSLEAATRLFLFDKFTGEVNPVLGGSSYTFNAGAPGNFTDRFFLTFNPARELDVQDVVHVFPNPSEQYVSIEVYQAESLGVEVLDSQGRIVLAKQFSERTDLDLGDLPGGIYLVRVLTNQGNVIKRLAKK